MPTMRKKERLGVMNSSDPPEVVQAVLSNPLAVAADSTSYPGGGQQMLTVIGRYRGDLHIVSLYPPFTDEIDALFRPACAMSGALRSAVTRIMWRVAS